MSEHAAVMSALATILEQLAEVRDVLARPEAPEWEPMQEACRNRRKGRLAIMAQMELGAIRFMRVPARGGIETILLKIEDLNRVFPVRKPARKKEQPAGDPPPAAG